MSAVEFLHAVHGDPFVACVYGPSGVGKTVDTGYSFPNALFLAAPGGLQSIRSVCGFVPESEPAETLGDVLAVLQRLKKTGSHRTVVVDDFSFTAQRTLASLESQKLSGWRLWGKLKDLGLALRDESRFCGVNVVLSCWEQAPKTKPDGSRLRGGPQLPLNLPDQIPAMCDVVLRAVHEPGRKPWPTAYTCSSNPEYITKDRYHVASRLGSAPMNLGEILRWGGAYVERAAHLPDQEEQVAALSQWVVSNSPDPKAINEVFRSLVQNGSTSQEAAWTMRDALDRAVLHRMAEKSKTTFI